MTRRALAAVALVAARVSASSKEVKALRKEDARCTIEPEHLPEPNHSWLVFTTQRSGSRWFVNTLTARAPEPYHVSVREIGLGGKEAEKLKESRSYPACRSYTPSKRCSCVLRRVFAKAAAAESEQHARHRAFPDDIRPGFKWMLGTDEWFSKNSRDHRRYVYSPRRPPKFNALVASVCELRIPFAIMLRKNILRREISNEANKMTAKAHAHTAKEVARLRAKPKPRLNAKHLVAKFNFESQWQSNIRKLFAYHCGEDDAKARFHWYEDLVAASPKRFDGWSDVLVTLGAWRAPNASRVREIERNETESVLAVHTGHVRDLVSNYADVERALRGTKYAWMLDA